MTNQAFELQNGILKIGGQQIALSNLVEKALEVNNLIIVLFNLEDGPKTERNIRAFTLQGKPLWEIEPSTYGGNDWNAFSNIWLSEQGELIALDWNGIQFKVNLKDGSLGEIIAFNRF